MIFQYKIIHYRQILSVVIFWIFFELAFCEINFGSSPRSMNVLKGRISNREAIIRTKKNVWNSIKKEKFLLINQNQSIPFLNFFL